MRWFIVAFGKACLVVWMLAIIRAANSGDAASVYVGIILWPLLAWQVYMIATDRG